MSMIRTRFEHDSNLCVIGEHSEEFNNHSTIDPGPYEGCEQVLTKFV
jgi:hypothetical protein